MTGIALYRLDVTAVQLQFVGDAGMAETVKDDSRKIILFDKFRKKCCDSGLLCRHAQAIGHDQIEVHIFTA